MFFKQYVTKLDFYNTIFMLQNYGWPDDTSVNNDYVNAIQSVAFKTPSRQKIHKTEKDEKLISQNDR